MQEFDAQPGVIGDARISTTGEFREAKLQERPYCRDESSMEFYLRSKLTVFQESSNCTLRAVRGDSPPKGGTDPRDDRETCESADRRRP